MSQASPPVGADARALPPPTLYDPRDDDGAPLAGVPDGPIVLLLRSDSAGSWAAETAFELCTQWARRDRRVVLADLDFEEPTLHELAGTDNLEGIVDVFLYGASVARSAHPVEGRGFFLIPAGTYTAEPDVVYHHSRWPKLATGFRDANATLALYGPAGAVDLEALAPHVAEVILLGSPDAALRERLRSTQLPVRALLVRPDPEAAVRSEPEADAPVIPPPAVATVAEAMRSAREEARPAEAAAPTPAREPRAAAPTASVEQEEELSLPPPPVRRRQTGRRLTFGLVILLAIGIFLAAGYVVATLRPDLLPWPELSLIGSPAEEEPVTIAAETAAAAPVPQGVELPFSVQVIAFQSLDAAMQHLASEGAAAEDLPLFVSPEDIQGIRYYKVLAGALADTAAARELKERLVDEGVVEDEDAAGSWTLIQSTPLAFDLGQHPDRAAAAAAADSLLSRQIPSYALPVAYSDGTYLWRVYGGAYRDSTTAQAMRELLAAASIAAPLVPRMGSPGAAP